jgi:hypothetical protein
LDRLASITSWSAHAAATAYSRATGAATGISATGKEDRLLVPAAMLVHRRWAVNSNLFPVVAATNSVGANG